MPRKLKVISGGQIGVDIAALRAAKRAGLETGGLMPIGFIAQDGLHPEYRELYGIKEYPGGYASRTWGNVDASDATLRIAYRWHSPGERCTLNAITAYKKPHLDINPANPLPPFMVAVWIQIFGVEVLNVAGNADRQLEPFVEEYLGDVFEERQ